MAQFQTSRVVTVSNRNGLHLRAATELAKLVRGFQAQVVILKNQDRANCGDVLETSSLGAAMNEQLLLEASGQEAEEALEAVSRLFASGFNENAQIENN
jgi:phosphotransferase system HPr (HPr) family protein